MEINKVNAFHFINNKKASGSKQAKSPSFCGNNEEVLKFLNYLGEVKKGGITIPSDIMNLYKGKDLATQEIPNDYEIKIAEDYTGNDIQDILCRHSFYGALSEDDKKAYKKEFFNLCNIKQPNGDFVFNKRYESKHQNAVFTDADIELIKNILDTKYSNKDKSDIIDEAIMQFANRQIQKPRLKQILYGINAKNSFLETKQKNKPETFFIDIKGYGKDQKWAEYMAQSADFAAYKIQNNESFENVLDGIAQDLSYFDMDNIKSQNDFEKALNSGKLRTESSGHILSITTFRPNGRKYGTYTEKFTQNAKQKEGTSFLSYTPKTPKAFQEIIPCEIIYYPDKQKGEIIHRKEGIEPAFEYCSNIYDSILKDFSNKKLNEKEIEEINTKVATMQWLLAQAMPYERGSDAIVNTFVKALYCSLGFETYPLKSGISLDLEAFSNEFEDYIQKYPNFYSEKPKYIS